MRLVDVDLVKKMLQYRLYKNREAYNNCKNGLDKIPTVSDSRNELTREIHQIYCNQGLSDEEILEQIKLILNREIVERGVYDENK